MQKTLLSILAIVFIANILQAQSKQYVLFEHFTQASCQPCAAQNPFFEEVRKENLNTVHHIAYHTSWPGIDPMYSLNPTEVNTRVDYYDITSVPSMQMLGKAWSGSPTGVSSSLITNATANTSPVKLKAFDAKDANDEHTVTVDVIETGELEGNDLRLRVAVVEREVNYITPPGSNGELNFPNVFRKMLTPPGGQFFNISGPGTEQSFTYNYSELSAYKSENLYILAWIQDDETGIIANSGSSIDANWVLTNESPKTTVAGQTTHSFDAKYVSETTTESLLVSVISDAPEDWTFDVSYDGNPIDLSSDDKVEVMVNAKEVLFTLNVHPGETGAIANYILQIESVEFPSNVPATVSYKVLSNITDLIIDHGGVATRFNDDYIAGLVDAGNRNYGILPLVDFKDSWDDGLLTSVINIYDNVSWTFPGLHGDEVEALTEFLDNGGNLFINGQDLGWDTWENTGTVATQAFYTNYMRANFVSDGSTADNKLTWNEDSVFSSVMGSSSIVDVHGGNMYPDNITPIEPAVSLYYYGSNLSNSGALRVEENNHKIVYLGVDLGMIADQEMRTAIVSISHDWFYGIISSVEYDEAIKQALGQNYPNPAAFTTTIPLSNLDKNATINVIDINGNILHTGSVNRGDTTYDLSVNDIPSGNYFYYLITSEGQSIPKKIVVIK